jgi:hypothetical protein
LVTLCFKVKPTLSSPSTSQKAAPAREEHCSAPLPAAAYSLSARVKGKDVHKQCLRCVGLLQLNMSHFKAGTTYLSVVFVVLKAMDKLQM